MFRIVGMASREMEWWILNYLASRLKLNDDVKPLKGMKNLFSLSPNLICLHILV